MTNTMLADALFAAFEAGDPDAVRSLCTSDFVARQNNGPLMDLETVLGFSAAVLGVVEHFRCEDAVRSETSSGFVEEHRVRGTLPDSIELDHPPVHYVHEASTGVGVWSQTSTEWLSRVMPNRDGELSPWT